MNRSTIYFCFHDLFKKCLSPAVVYDDDKEDNGEIGPCLKKATLDRKQDAHHHTHSTRTVSVIIKCCTLAHSVQFLVKILRSLGEK